MSSISKGVVILAGIVCFAIALANVAMTAFTWGFVCVLAFSVLVAPRMTLTLPRSRFAISFSDALVFFTFLLYGGPAAIVVAALESFANCLYLRSKGFPFGRLMIPTNVSINTVSTTVTFAIWQMVTRFGYVADPDVTQHLISIVGFLALTQFAVSSFLASAFQALKDGSNLFATWRRDCFSSSMTQIVGSALAGLVFKLINYGDLLTGAIAFFAGDHIFQLPTIDR